MNLFKSAGMAGYYMYLTVASFVMFVVSMIWGRTEYNTLWIITLVYSVLMYHIETCENTPEKVKKFFGVVLLIVWILFMMQAWSLMSGYFFFVF